MNRFMVRRVQPSSRLRMLNRVAGTGEEQNAWGLEVPEGAGPEPRKGRCLKMQRGLMATEGGEAAELRDLCRWSHLEGSREIKRGLWASEEPGSIHYNGGRACISLSGKG